MRLPIILAALALASSAFAQTPPAATDFESAISEQVAAEHWAFLKANANVKLLSQQVQELQKQVAKLGADLAAAKATDPKTPEPPKDAKPQ
jgi:hypothetical protein